MDAHPFNLSFSNLAMHCCDPKIIFRKSEQKRVLKSVSGEFRAGELTAILGKSGSGKSSLLNCLSGFQVAGVSGKILINNHVTEVNSIRRISSYVMQEQTLHMLLTVWEIMRLSLNLRDRKKMCDSEKIAKIKSVLTKLNIEGKRHTFIRDLSGGEKKRLQIAIELVNDPKILFLDEPTTSIDSVASTQCVELLKKLAVEEQKVIVCTIHQPSNSLLKMFEHLYVLADGSCIYQGSPPNLVPFLRELNLACPPTYNPTDFLLEIANNDYGPQNDRLIERIENGQNMEYRNAELWNNNNINQTNDHLKALPPTSSSAVAMVEKSSCACSFRLQVYYLMTRIYLTISRDMSLFYLRIILHLIIGMTFGFIYKDVGNKGSAMLDNYRYLVVTVVFLLFTSYHSLFVAFPLEFAAVKREHFNGWYSTRAYYAAFILADVPITLACNATYVSITYWCTDQPRELYRFFLFISFTIAMSFAAQSLGIMFTALMDVKMATIFGSMFLMPFFLFSGIMILTKDAPPIFKFLFDTNFLDSSLKGVLNSVLGFNRSKLPCEDRIYCHFGNPRKVLRDFGAEVVDVKNAFGILLVYIFTSQAAAFLMMRYRLKHSQT